MSTNYYRVAAGLCLYFIASGIAHSQTGPEFLSCSNEPVRLCIADEGVRLPANNQYHLGEGHAEATSCSVHLVQKKKVKITCGASAQYQVELFLFDSSTALLLQPPTTIQTDSLGEAELSFDTELSSDSIIRADGIPYSTDCFSFHKIKWIVTDSCGQTDTCEQVIDLYDCQPPQVSYPPDIIFQIIIPLGCALNLYAIDFIGDIKDDCTIEDDFLLSLKEDTFLPYSYLDPCEVPAFGVEVPFDIWIADKGRDEDCNGSVEWSERSKYKHTVTVIYGDSSGGGCLDCFDNFYIRGKIETEDQTGVELVHVNLSAVGQVYPTYITAQDGAYVFNSSQFNVPTTIRPSRDDWHKNGVSILDLVKIQKHLLGLELLSSPYKLIAADANNSQNVSAIDLIEIRKLILGRYQVFPNSPSWKFVRKDYVFGDTLNPGQSPWVIENTNPEGSDNNDFIGIKIGDVNNSVDPLQGDILPRTQLPIFPLHIQNNSFQKGEIFSVDLMAGEETSLLGFQFTLAHPGLILERISAGEISIAEEQFERFDGYTTFSWYDIDALQIDPDAFLMTLHFRAMNSGSTNQSISINSTYTEAEWYDVDEKSYTPVLQTQYESVESDLELFLPVPNPWKESSVLAFILLDNSEITFTSYDASGRKVYEVEKFCTAGYNEIEFLKEDFPKEGIYFFNLQSEQTSANGKFVVLR